MSRFFWRRCRTVLLSQSSNAVLASIALTLTLSSVTCTPATSDAPSPPQAADAEATSVRRTAVANVQRLLSGDVVPTPTPESTPLPRPTCEGAIWWYDARSHIGESRIIQGTIIRARPAPDANVLLELGQPYPDPTGFAVLVPAASSASPRLEPGKTLCVQGRIVNVMGSPAIVERDPSTIVVLN